MRISLPLVVALAVSSCEPAAPTREVVVYTALDRAFSEPIFEAFTRDTGIRVLAQYDTESTKTVGLANRVRAERARPRCDVFWNNEIVNTLRLKAEGLLEPFTPRDAESFPAAFRDPDRQWYGFAARARVLIVNTDLVPRDAFPTSVDDLAAPRWRGRTAIAKPLFGTTASHVACLVARLGEAEAMARLDAMKANGIQIHGGNKGCAVAVAEGKAAFGLTDTDDAIIEKEAGKPIAIVFPDQGEGGAGALLLPNTLALIKGAPHRDEALALIDYLLSAEVEAALAAGPSAQLPLRPGVPSNDRLGAPRDLQFMEVDFEKAAAAFDAARKLVEERFLR